MSWYHQKSIVWKTVSQYYCIDLITDKNSLWFKLTLNMLDMVGYWYIWSGNAKDLWQCGNGR